MRLYHEIEPGDPSEVKQIFIAVPIDILCCRYWILKQWECNEMAFPYWRIYWNKNEGGSITYLGNEIKMKKKFAYIIPPSTSFRSHITNQKILKKGINVTGREVRFDDDENFLQQDHVLHLFLHFNLGLPLDRVKPGIFEIEPSQLEINNLDLLTSTLKQNPSELSIQDMLHLHSTILSLLGKLPQSTWEDNTIDFRVEEIIHYIDGNMGENFSNEKLASRVNLTTNSLTRLFTLETGISLQKFIKTRKIGRACVLLEHTDKSIDQIAGILGFANRYHFSRVFKSVTSSSPAKVRKESLIRR